MGIWFMYSSPNDDVRARPASEEIEKQENGAAGRCPATPCCAGLLFFDGPWVIGDTKQWLVSLLEQLEDDHGDGFEVTLVARRRTPLEKRMP